MVTFTPCIPPINLVRAVPWDGMVGQARNLVTRRLLPKTLLLKPLEGLVLQSRSRYQERKMLTKKVLDHIQDRVVAVKLADRSTAGCSSFLRKSNFSQANSLLLSSSYFTKTSFPRQRTGTIVPTCVRRGRLGTLREYALLPCGHLVDFESAVTEQMTNSRAVFIARLEFFTLSSLTP